MATMKQALARAGVKVNDNGRGRKPANHQGRAPKLYTPATDDIDHINIHTSGKVQWARRLFTGYLDFVHPVLGAFPNLNNFMLYISAKRDKREGFRSMSNVKAEKILSKHRERIYRHHGRALADAYRCILMDHPSLANNLVSTKLPLASYSVFKNQMGLEIPTIERVNRDVLGILRDLKLVLTNHPQNDLKENLQYDYRGIMEELMANVAVAEETPAYFGTTGYKPDIVIMETDGAPEIQVVDKLLFKKQESSDLVTTLNDFSEDVHVAEAVRKAIADLKGHLPNDYDSRQNRLKEFWAEQSTEGDILSQFDVVLITVESDDEPYLRHQVGVVRKETESLFRSYWLDTGAVVTE